LEVYNEATTGTHPAVTVVQSASWIEVQSVSDTQKVLSLQTDTRLDLGECAAIILAEELSANQLLLDDLAGRREAQARGLPVIGTVGIVLLAKERGLIFSVTEVLDELIANGTRIGQRLYDYALAVAGE
jgi:predicted nucleic acid-binding protein